MGGDLHIIAGLNTVTNMVTNVTNIVFLATKTLLAVVKLQPDLLDVISRLEMKLIFFPQFWAYVVQIMTNCWRTE